MKKQVFARRFTLSIILFVSIVLGSHAALAATFTVDNQTSATGMVKLTFTDLTTQYVAVTTTGITTADIGSKTLSQVEVNNTLIAPTGTTLVSVDIGTIVVSYGGATEVLWGEM